MSGALRAAEPSVVHVFAAGSLRSAFTEIGIAFHGATRIRLESSFGPSGALRQRIEKGEQPDLFASAVLLTKNESTAALVFFILSQNGQSILARNGFDAPLLLPGQH